MRGSIPPEAIPSTPGFWPGYWLWLGFHRKKLLVIGLALVLLFSALLIASRTPQDPFSYDIY